ncbi:DUF4236 domain-containing protein [Pseudonocardia nigra]|uniref:DUF4236 domain-containing protein n=1 Tax=Pseudonocardia nigra TaxID=1921578 RepID=UPI001C5FB4CF|nr:DUF4236 domain-containing protein [Pseudonocardia nigra]
MRTSIKIMPGVRLNISRSGVGYSVGGRGLRVTKHANGRVSRTVGIPGTGLSHSSTVRAPRSRATPRRPSPPARPAPRPPKPGLLAPSWEKDLFDAVEAGRPARLAAVARAHGRSEPVVRVLAAALDGLLHVEHLADGTGDPERARELLAWVVAQGPVGLGRHPFATKYLAERTWPVEIAAGVVAHLGLHHDVVHLAAAELHQAGGDLDTAIWTVEQAQPMAPAALSLVELYSDADRHQDVVDLTNGIDNADDATALLLVLRGRAFAQLGYHEAAREAIKEAMRVRSRAVAVRHRALLERGQVNLAQNRRAAARTDLEKILAEDAAYPGLADALAALP